jgi:enamine deaminase RidA (YjgF/YER057c/UK114 family)
MNQPAALTPTDSPALHIMLGSDNRGLLFDAGTPVLAGEAVEKLFADARPAGRMGALSLYQAGDWLVGAATVTLAAGLETAAHQLYGDILRATRGLQLARIWNYVPAINEPGTDGLENYRIFCRARSLAFEEHHGAGFKSLLPAASAVGTKSASLTAVFAASPIRPRHVENPLQVSAYDYPEDYGPRAPSFARATVVPGNGLDTVFISGTAAIRGHATIAPQHLRPQLECTLENLAEISSACGLGVDLARGRAASRHFKVYLRHATDQAEVAAGLQEKLLSKADRVSYLHSDICRTELLVEIEATLLGVKG